MTFFVGIFILASAIIVRPDMSTVKIGDYIYDLRFTDLQETSYEGLTSFPMTDGYGHRLIQIEETLSELQAKNVVWHEFYHACNHNHPHNFKSVKGLESHLWKPYNEETLNRSVSPCTLQILRDNPGIENWLLSK